MSKRIWIGLLFCLGATTAYAEPGEPASRGLQSEMQLGNSSWFLYRPPRRSPAIYDIDYMLDRLRCDLPGYALRFSDSPDFTFDLKFAPLLDSNDFIGPVYDMNIGATQLVFSFTF